MGFVPLHAFSWSQDWIAHYWFRGATPEELLEDSPQQFQDARLGAVRCEVGELWVFIVDLLLGLIVDNKPKS